MTDTATLTLVALVLAALATIVACVEPFLVVYIAPKRTSQRVEARSRAIFRELTGLGDEGTLLDAVAKLVPSAGAIADAVLMGLPALPAPPSAEEQAAAQEALAQRIQAAIAEGVAGVKSSAMQALGKQGVEARETKADLERLLKENIGQHPKGGAPALLAMAAWKRSDPKGYAAALADASDVVLYAPDNIAGALEKILGKLPGLGVLGKPDKPKVTVV